MKTLKNSQMFSKIRRQLMLFFAFLGILILLVVALFLTHNTYEIKASMAKDTLKNQSARITAISLAVSKSKLTQSSFDSHAVEDNIQIFESVLSDIENGNIPIDSGKFKFFKKLRDNMTLQISEVRLAWENYQQLIPQGKQIETDFQTFYQAGNTLIAANENLILTFTTTTHERLLITVWALFLLTLLCLLGLAYIIHALYRYILLGLTELYNGFYSLGLSSTDSKTESLTVEDEIRNIFTGIRNTMELVEQVNANVSFSDTLNYIFETFIQYIPYTYIGIALFKQGEASDHLIASYGISEGPQHANLANQILGYEVPLDETSLGKLLANQKPRIINDLDAYFETHEIKSYSKILLENGIKSSITLPLVANGQSLGFIFFSSSQKNVYTKKHIDYLHVISNSIALSFQKNIFVDDLLYSTVLALAKLSEARDGDTGDHLQRISKYCGIIAKAMYSHPKYRSEVDLQFISDIERFSPMHDIGKVGIPDDILLKPGKLTADEFKVMKTHATYGANVLVEAEKNLENRGKSLFSMGIDIALHHHEKFDGSGYPEKLKGKEIPLAARIVSIADVYDALLSKRPYKSSMPRDKVLELMKAGRGTHFDPEIFDIFIEVEGALYAVYLEFKKNHTNV